MVQAPSGGRSVDPRLSEAYGDVSEQTLSSGENPGDSNVSKALAKTGAQLQKLLRTAVRDGVGPLTGSVAYAEARLAGQSGRGSGGGFVGAITNAGGNGPDDPDDPTVAVEAAIRRIVRESVAAAGTSGFITGVGGLVALPVTLPLNIAGSLIINARMVGSIAYLRGYEVDDPHTEAMLTLVVAGNSARAALSAFGVQIGRQAAKGTIKRVPVAAIREINRKAGFYLVAKYGTKRSTVTLAKAIPGIGGLVGGGVDAALTRSIASVAKKVFPRID
jgi:hypothetical protein